LPAISKFTCKSIQVFAMSKLDVTPEATQRRISKIESEIGAQQETVSKMNHDLLEAMADLYALEEDLHFWRGE
jgi:hypothetical protein